MADGKPKRGGFSFPPPPPPPPRPVVDNSRGRGQDDHRGRGRGFGGHGRAHDSSFRGGSRGRGRGGFRGRGDSTYGKQDGSSRRNKGSRETPNRASQAHYFHQGNSNTHRQSNGQQQFHGPSQPNISSSTQAASPGSTAFHMPPAQQSVPYAGGLFGLNPEASMPAYSDQHPSAMLVGLGTHRPSSSHAHSQEGPSQAIRLKPKSSHPKVAPPPAVPSFMDDLNMLKRPAAVADGGTAAPSKKQKVQRSRQPAKPNTLGLTPGDPGDLAFSDSEDDAREEERMAAKLKADGGALRFEHNGKAHVLDTVDKVKAYIEDRKKQYPTAARVSKRQEETARRRKEVNRLRDEIRRKRIAIEGPGFDDRRSDARQRGRQQQRSGPGTGKRGRANTKQSGANRVTVNTAASAQRRRVNHRDAQIARLGADEEGEEAAQPSSSSEESSVVSSDSSDSSSEAEPPPSPGQDSDSDSDAGPSEKPARVRAAGREAGKSEGTTSNKPEPTAAVAGIQPEASTAPNSKSINELRAQGFCIHYAKNNTCRHGNACRWRHGNETRSDARKRQRDAKPAREERPVTQAPKLGVEARGHPTLAQRLAAVEQRQFDAAIRQTILWLGDNGYLDEPSPGES